MSDLQRSFARAKLASLPLDPPLPADQFSYEGEGENGIYAGEENDKVNALRLSAEASQDDDSSSSASSSASSASSTGTIRPSPSKHLFARPNKGFVLPLYHYALVIILESSCPPGSTAIIPRSLTTIYREDNV